MAVPRHFSIFRTAAEEAAEMKRSDAEAAIHELMIALYTEDVRLGIVGEANLPDDGDGFGPTGGANYHRRAMAMLDRFSQLSERKSSRHAQPMKAALQEAPPLRLNWTGAASAGRDGGDSHRRDGRAQCEMRCAGART
jgi:hypothetical protein